MGGLWELIKEFFFQLKESLFRVIRLVWGGIKARLLDPDLIAGDVDNVFDILASFLAPYLYRIVSFGSRLIDYIIDSMTFTVFRGVATLVINVSIFVLLVFLRITTPKFSLAALTKQGWMYSLMIISLVMILVWLWA